MFSDKTSHIDDNTIELLENAQNRVCLLYTSDAADE